MDTNAAPHDTGVIVGRVTSGPLQHARTVLSNTQNALDRYKRHAPKHLVDQEVLEDLRTVRDILIKYKRTTSGTLHSLE